MYSGHLARETAQTNKSEPSSLSNDSCQHTKSFIQGQGHHLLSYFTCSIPLYEYILTHMNIYYLCYSDRAGNVAAKERPVAGSECEHTALCCCPWLPSAVGRSLPPWASLDTEQTRAGTWERKGLQPNGDSRIKRPRGFGPWTSVFQSERSFILVQV